jgi:hypothetical protein
MACLVTIVQLEAAINRAMQQHPALDYVLSPEVDALAEIYGRMIYQKKALADLDQVPALISAAVIRWLAPSEVVALELVQPACFYRPGDPRFESCEVCQ